MQPLIIARQFVIISLCLLCVVAGNAMASSSILIPQQHALTSSIKTKGGAGMIIYNWPTCNVSQPHDCFYQAAQAAQSNSNCTPTSVGYAGITATRGLDMRVLDVPNNDVTRVYFNYVAIKWHDPTAMCYAHQ